MNNYNQTKDYYNYVNNTYNQPNFNQNQVQPNLYNPYNGFIRGNMFPELYNAYKINQPFEIKPMNEQAELLTYIDALGFATIDLDLYLDNFPDDRKALELFNQYRSLKDEYMSEYQNKYGPLVLNSEALASYPWKWVQGPWPWEK